MKLDSVDRQSIDSRQSETDSWIQRFSDVFIFFEKKKNVSLKNVPLCFKGFRGH